MRIFKLLEELCIELRKFNSNVEYFSLLEGEARRRKNPICNLHDADKINLKLWIKKKLEEKNISLDDCGYVLGCARSFIKVDTRRGTKTGRDYISVVLGYASFEEMVKAWREEKADARQARGGAA